MGEGELAAIPCTFWRFSSGHGGLETQVGMGCEGCEECFYSDLIDVVLSHLGYLPYKVTPLKNDAEMTFTIPTD
jgi:hypothetical protein